MGTAEETEKEWDTLSFNVDSRHRQVLNACKLEMSEVSNDESQSEATHKRRIGIIRNTPVSIGQKRELRTKYLQNEDGERVIYQHHRRPKKHWKKFKQSISRVNNFFTLWGSSLKRIEGKFGNATVSYFVFLKWLFLLNLYASVLLVVFVILPEVANRITNIDVVLNYNETAEECKNLYLDSIDVACKQNGSIVDCLQNALDGRGWIEETILFYGSYTPVIVDSADISDAMTFVIAYHRPLAYLLTIIAYLTISLVLMISYVSKLFEMLVVDQFTKTTSSTKFSNHVLAGWDYAIAQDRAAVFKHRTITHLFEVELESERIQIAKSQRTIVQIIGINSVRLFVHFLVILCNLSAFYLIYFTTQFNLNTDFINSDFQSTVKFLITWLPPVTITLLNNIIPNIFMNIAQYEMYTPNFEVSLTLLRSSFLKMASLLILLISLYNNINCPESNKDECNACIINNRISCWETSVGQEFYKLTVVDLLSIVFTIIFWEYPRKFISRKIRLAQGLGNIEFELPKNVLALVYSQAISWIGAFFCPFLTLITLLKLLIIFHMRKWSLLHNMVPSVREARASQTGLFFMLLLMATFLMCLVPIGYAVAIFQPSVGCGPFRSLETMWSQVFIVVKNWDNSFLTTLYDLIGSTPVIISMISGSVMILYYQYSQSATSAQLLNKLKLTLVLERRTKHAIIRKINDVKKKKERNRHLDEKENT